MPFSIAIEHTPIFNIPTIAQALHYPLVDQQGLFRPLEMIAFPGEVFKVEEEISPHILRVSCSFYPSQKSLFIDKRMVKPTQGLKIRQLNPLTLNEVQNNLRFHLGRPYVWGGNAKSKLLSLLKLYPVEEKLSGYHELIYTMDGVDCSGLLYEATCGYTPRNTSMLYDYGKGIAIEKKRPSSMNLQPLDLILYHEHVIIVLDDTYCIQSKEKWGVYLTPISDVLSRLFRIKKPIDSWQPNQNGFIVRRWFN